jgi:hypothetical protein
VDSEIVESRSRRRHHLASVGRQQFGANGYAGRALLDLMRDNRYIIANRDIDGLVCATLLSQATGWKIAAVVWAGRGYLHPEFEDFDELVACGAVGADIYSPRFPSFSNHMQLLGGDWLTDDVAKQDVINEHDREIAQAATQRETYAFAPSIWAGSQAGNWDDADVHSRRYRYPMGSSQFTLALLESLGVGPTFRDLYYSPHLVAHCDGALETAVTAGYNVLPWLDTLAAVAGLGSWTAHIRSALNNGGPDVFARLVRSLHGENAAVAECLTLDWNLSGAGKASVHKAVVAWLIAENGWDDPFLPVPAGYQRGAFRESGLDGYYTYRARKPWREVNLAGDHLVLDAASIQMTPLGTLEAQLAEVRASVHTAAYQRDSVTLLWNG